MGPAKGTILITGANGGLGSAIAADISRADNIASAFHCIYTVRKTEATTRLAAVLRNAVPQHRNDVVSLELSSLAAVRRFAAEINARVASGELDPIRALILNAGYQEHTTQEVSVDGLAMGFQCNYLSHWLLTLMLLQSMDKEHGRVVVIGSWSHDPWDYRNDGMGAFTEPKWKTLFVDTDAIARGTWSSSKDDPSMQAGFRRYGASKLCEIMMIYELQQRLDDDPQLNNITVLGVDPGGMASILTWFCPNGTLRSTSKSASDVLRAALDTKELGARPKALYMNGSEVGKSSPESKDPQKRKLLWGDSVRYVSLTKEDTILQNWQ